MTNLELYKQVLEEVKTSAETNSALALGPGAVHNLWLAIQEIGRAAEPSVARFKLHGELLPGLSFDPATGRISGVPETAGDMRISVEPIL